MDVVRERRGILSNTRTFRKRIDKICRNYDEKYGFSLEIAINPMEVLTSYAILESMSGSVITKKR